MLDDFESHTRMNTPRTTLLLVRHGATPSNERVPYVLQGDGIDTALSERGRAQAGAVAEFLAPRRIDAVFASGMIRARETAGLIAARHGLDVSTEPALKEVHVGRWEGKSWAEILEAHPAEHAAFHARPGLTPYLGGESYLDVLARVRPVFDRLLVEQAGRTFAVVAHNVVNRAWLAAVLGLPIDAAKAIEQTNCCVNVVERVGDAPPRVLTLNSDFHVPGGGGDRASRDRRERSRVDRSLRSRLRRDALATRPRHLLQPAPGRVAAVDRRTPGPGRGRRTPHTERAPMRRPPASLAGTACLLVLTGTALGQARLTARTPARTAGVEAGAAARPAPAADRVQRFSPAVEAVLATWYEATRGVRRLEGEHTEIQYSNAFGVEYRRQGQFFYEAPDHGRIDLAPTDVTGLKSLRKLPNGQPFTVQAGTPERWICDGTQILSIDDEKRQVSPVPIPAEQRGSNIMDGPLPFLLGMPPEKVRRRFRVTLHAHGSKPGPDVAAWLRDPAVKTVMLDIRPRLEQDAQNWERAEVHLVKPTFLPSAVQLTSPGGEQQTVYRFGELTVNAGAVKRFFTGDPFEPNLRGYKTAQLDPSAGAPRGERRAVGGRAELGAGQAGARNPRL